MSPTEYGRTSSGRVVFLGAVHEAEPALRELLESSAKVVGLLTYDEILGARTSGFVDLSTMAAAYRVPVFRTADANAPESVDWVRALAPDLIVCVGWTRLLGPELLSVPVRGAIGFHASLLPHNRGRAPVNWAILRGERVTGNTMMKLAPGVDTGDIVDQREVRIEDHDTCATVYDKVAQTGVDMLREHLPALLAGTEPRRPQQHHEVEPMLPKRTPAMGITSFDRTAREVFDWIRALTRPYPGAVAYVGGQRVTLWSAKLGGPGTDTAPPGTMLGLIDTGVLVATCEGTVQLLEVQEEGGPVEPARCWSIRRGLAPGARFDPVDERTLAWALGGPPPTTGSVPPLPPAQRAPLTEESLSLEGVGS